MYFITNIATKQICQLIRVLLSTYVTYKEYKKQLQNKQKYVQYLTATTKNKMKE